VTAALTPASESEVFIESLLHWDIEFQEFEDTMDVLNTYYTITEFDI
jgi:hypothetical protein